MEERAKQAAAAVAGPSSASAVTAGDSVAGLNAPELIRPSLVAEELEENKIGKMTYAVSQILDGTGLVLTLPLLSNLAVCLYFIVSLTNTITHRFILW